jgi:heat shock protein HslJ
MTDKRKVMKRPIGWNSIYILAGTLLVTNLMTDVQAQPPAGGAPAKPAATSPTVSISTYDSGPLNTLAPGGQWHRIQLSVNPKGDGVLQLDPNRINWDGYSKNWMSTRMAPQSVAVRLREVKGIKNPPGQPRPAFPPRVFDVTPTDLPAGGKLSDMGLGGKLRFSVSNDRSKPGRLLLLDGSERITQVIPLAFDNAGAGGPPVGDAGDLISYKTAFLGGKMGRVSSIKLSGSVSSGAVNVILDGNAVMLDSYGNPSISTMMAPIPRQAKLIEKTDLPEDAAGNVRVFDLDGAPMPMSLVLPKTANGVARLIVNDESGKAKDYLTLERDYTTANPLTRSSWTLTRIAYSDDRTIKPEKGGSYALLFTPDGRVAGRADINRILTTYVVSEERLSIAPVASTRAAIPAGGIEGEFTKALANVSSYKVQGDELWLMLKYDSGTMIFQRAK